MSEFNRRLGVHASSSWFEWIQHGTFDSTDPVLIEIEKTVRRLNNELGPHIEDLAKAESYSDRDAKAADAAYTNIVETYASIMGRTAEKVECLAHQAAIMKAVDAGKKVLARLGVSKWDGMPVERLDLSVRSRNALQRNGFCTVGEVAEATDEELLSFRNFGRTSLREVRQKLAEVLAND